VEAAWDRRVVCCKLAWASLMRMLSSEAMAPRRATSKENALNVLLMAPQRATYSTDGSATKAFEIKDILQPMAQPLKRAARPRRATFKESLLVPTGTVNGFEFACRIG